MSADSASDAWAVGFTFPASGVNSLAEHWTGHRWTVVPVPNPGSAFDSLEGVSARSSSDAWAVGSYIANQASKTLVLHWNGSKSTQVPSPSPDSSSGLNGVVAISASDAWAVGCDCTDRRRAHDNPALERQELGAFLMSVEVAVAVCWGPAGGPHR